MKLRLLALAAALSLAACVNVHVHFPGAPADQTRPADKTAK
jgi:ABC-type glycerol-3-phosphate transport system substrate-binding protein